MAVTRARGGRGEGRAGPKSHPDSRDRCARITAQAPAPWAEGPITGRDRSRKGRRPLRAHRRLSTRPLGCGPRAGVLRVRPGLPRLPARLEAASPGEAASRWWVVRAARVLGAAGTGSPPCYCAGRLLPRRAWGTPTPAVSPPQVHRLQTAPAERPHVRWARSPSARCQGRAARRASPGAASLRRAEPPAPMCADLRPPLFTAPQGERRRGGMRAGPVAALTRSGQTRDASVPWSDV